MNYQIGLYYYEGGCRSQIYCEQYKKNYICDSSLSKKENTEDTIYVDGPCIHWCPNCARSKYTRIKSGIDVKIISIKEYNNLQNKIKELEEKLNEQKFN